MPEELPDLAHRAAAADPGEGLSAIVALRRRLDALESVHVERALEQGWSWRRIGEALEVTKQAVHRRHARRPATPAAAATPVAPQAPASTPVPVAPTRAMAERGRARLVVTGEARLSVEHARREAARLGQPSVLPEHLLLGLLHADDAAPVRALAGLGASPDDVCAEIGRLGAEARAERREPPAPGARPPISARARAVFEQSLREAVDRGDPHLGPEHLLLALLRAADELPARALERLGLSAANVERRLAEVLAEEGGTRGSPGPRSA